MRPAYQLSAALVATLIAAPALAEMGEQYGRYHHGMGWGGWFAGPVMLILFIGLIVVAVVVTARLLGYEAGGKSSGAALDILKERFAKGEIDKAEFEERRNALKD
ncbi:SHOCT domain-containing protein [bacterium]|nr:SHOCT domain-containing protein [bacterium]